jgi:hypothetical protein
MRAETLGVLQHEASGPRPPLLIPATLLIMIFFTTSLTGLANHPDQRFQKRRNLQADLLNHF